MATWAQSSAKWRGRRYARESGCGAIRPSSKRFAAATGRYRFASAPSSRASGKSWIRSYASMTRYATTSCSSAANWNSICWSQEEEARQPGDGGRCAAGNERAEERLRAATGPIDAVLGEHARESRWTFRGARPVACSAAYLISRSATDRFLGAFTRLCAERRDFSLILGKPLAPYSFVSIADRAPPGVASPRESVASAQESGASLRG
jgi:hypothetical protein